MNKVFVASVVLVGSGGFIFGQNFQPPNWAGEEGTEFSEWLNFSVPFGGPNTPDIVESTGDALLQQNIPGASITGSLNIYNPAGASEFVVADTFAQQPEIIIFEARVSGTQLDVDSVRLGVEQDEETVSLGTVREELGRVAGGFGDTVTSRWTWNLRGYDASSATIRFAATGAHCSFVAARLDVRYKPDASPVVQNAPVQDRWNYPFNATPGTRSVASVFRSIEEEGVVRHGSFVFGFDTSAALESGRGAAAYEIISAKVTLMTSSNFEVVYDPTVDSVYTYLTNGHPQYVEDADAGRPLELFGTGFRNGGTAATWAATDAYAPVDGERTVYPVTWDHSGNEVDASMNVNFAAPYEARPLAAGVFSGVTAGEYIPHDTAVEFDVDLSDAGVVKYLRNALNNGILYFTATGLHGGGQGVRTFPEYYTSDSLVGEGPKLELEVRLYGTQKTVTISSITPSVNSRTLRFPSEKGDQYGIRWSDDLKSFYLINDPVITTPESGVSEWVDSDPEAGSARFYQVYLKP